MTYSESVDYMTVEKNVAGLKSFHVGMSIIQFFGQHENAMGCAIVQMELMKATVIFVKVKRAGNVRAVENVLIRVSSVMGLMIARINPMNRTVSHSVVISIEGRNFFPTGRLSYNESTFVCKIKVLGLKLTQLELYC